MFAMCGQNVGTEGPRFTPGSELVALRAEVVALDVDAVREDVTDHESRIRPLERWVWGAAGLGTISGAGLSQIIARLLGG